MLFSKPRRKGEGTLNISVAPVGLHRTPPQTLVTGGLRASLNPIGTLLRTLCVSQQAMRRSSTDETPYRRSPSLESKAGTPPFSSGFHRYSGEFEYKRPPFAFGFHTAKGPQGSSDNRYGQSKKYVVFYLDLSFIFLLELRRCRMAEGCMMGLRYGMVFFNLLFWVSALRSLFPFCVCVRVRAHVCVFKWKF